MNKWAKAIKRFSGRGVGLVAFFALWEFLPRAGLVDQTFFSPPSLVLQALVSLVKSGAIWPHVESSLQRSFLGLGLSILLGTSLGIFLGWFKRLEYLVDPVLQTFRQLPSLALFPVFILFFGIGELSKVTIIFWASLWPILLNTINGVKNVDKILLDSAKSLGASQRFIFLKVVLPAAVPEIMTGIRLGGAHSVVALVAAEMIGAEAGLGFLVFYSQETFKVPNMFAAIVCLALVGLALNYLLVFIEARLTRWKRSSTENA
ncbi:ABC transporter permease [Anaeroarcus burkinensis]|uniref:ABC transporter permease n=1 Tax=Anaeroarcus burkinensis TaxID=82376 RepID=UPI0004223744|nr:ABC transporter permease [Anaeroarcus burkinensis]